MLKQTMIIGPHMVVVVTVKALAVRDFSRKCMTNRVPVSQSGHGLVSAFIFSVIVVANMTGGAAGCPVKPPAAGPFRIKVAPQAPSPQEIIHQRRGRIGRDGKVLLRQRFERTAETVNSGSSSVLGAPQIPRLIDNSGHGTMQGVFDPVDLFLVARQAEESNRGRVRRISNHLRMPLFQERAFPFLRSDMTGGTIESMVFAHRLNSLMARETIPSFYSFRLRSWKNCGEIEDKNQKSQSLQKKSVYSDGDLLSAWQIGLRLEAFYGTLEILVDGVVVSIVASDAGLYRNNFKDLPSVKRSDAAL